jgi:hypothetical protein
MGMIKELLQEKRNPAAEDLEQAKGVWMAQQPLAHVGGGVQALHAHLCSSP